jgi:pyruvate-formate lyase-activating enzyme
MHLAEMAMLRTVPAAAVFLSLTRRCPLSCAHCSTDSALDSEQYAEEPFLALVGSFAPDDHPQIIAMSGGEALLRAELVRDLATTARLAGVRSYLLSGMYFARDGRAIPPRLARAIAAVDHFAASLDEFHEREVGRRDVFRALRQVMDLTGQVSLQLTGRGDDDPYLAGLVADVRREFGDRVPMLVGQVSPLGRARQWLPGRPGRRASVSASVTPAALPQPSPCDLAAWPLVTYDGTVFGCCNQDLLEGARPPHLIIGHAAADGWPVLRDRFMSRQLLRSIRVFGPRYTQARFGGGCADDGYCASCVGLGRQPQAAERLDDYLASPGGRGLETALREVIERPDPRDFSRRVGSPRYSDLVLLGWSETGPSRLAPDATSGTEAR